MAIVEIKGLTKRYGKFSALDKLNLEVKKGEVLFNNLKDAV